MTDIQWIALAVKIVLVMAGLLSVAPVMNWVERRGAALIQNRLGPNQIGPLGIFQVIPDGIKFMFKEDRVPAHVWKFYYILGPILVLVPACMTFAVIPFGSYVKIAGETILLQAANLDIGFLYIFAIGSLGVYGIIIGGWASNNKYALLGSMRSSSQMISYEVSMGLSIIGLVMIYSTLNLNEMVVAQAQPFFQLGPITIPKWGIFVQPIGFFMFLTAMYAETNRLPFDLPEGEPEIVGFHVEYGSMKFAIYMMAEYMNMAVASALTATFFFGGYQMLPGMSWILDQMGLVGDVRQWGQAVFEMLSLVIKIGLFMWLYVWVRWTLPRFRYDQLMDLGWKVMLPVSLLNILFTGVMVYLKWV